MQAPMLQPMGGGSFSGNASVAVVTDANGALTSSVVTAAELARVSGVLLPMPRVVVKAANQSRNSTTTYADDDTLLFTAEANKSYRVKIWVEYTLGAGGAKFQIAGPASTTINRMEAHSVAGSVGHQNGTGTAPVVVFNDANTSGTYALVIECIVRTTNAGTLALQWAQSTSNGANSTVLASSYIEWQKLN